MPLVTGDTYDIRDRLKGMGCKWVESEHAWDAPDEVSRGLAQALADAEPFRKWREFLNTLAWAKGSFTTTAFQAGLNACSRGIPIALAVSEVAERIMAAGKSPEAGWVERNVGRAYDYAEPPSSKAGVSRGKCAAPDPALPVKPKPKFEESALADFAGPWAEAVDTAWLADRSPVDPAGITASEFLRHLYAPGECVVVLDVFASQGQWVFTPEGGLESSKVDYRAWQSADPHHTAAPPVCAGNAFAAQGPQGIWYLCNPVDGKFRVMEEKDKFERPKWSRRWEPCVTAWRYFVFESDAADPKAWMGAMVQLPMRIAAIYTSGGASIHVLVQVDAASKVQFDQWRETAKRAMIPLGADPGCMSAVRLTRLPGCLRLQDKEGKPFERPHLQKLLYLAPCPEAKPLVTRSPVRDSFGPWERWALATLDSGSEDVAEEDFNALVRGLRVFRSARATQLLGDLKQWR